MSLSSGLRLGRRQPLSDVLSLRYSCSTARILCFGEIWLDVFIVRGVTVPRCCEKQKNKMKKKIKTGRDNNHCKIFKCDSLKDMLYTFSSDDRKSICRKVLKLEYFPLKLLSSSPGGVCTSCPQQLPGSTCRMLSYQIKALTNSKREEKKQTSTSALN